MSDNSEVPPSKAKSKKSDPMIPATQASPVLAKPNAFGMGFKPDNPLHVEALKGLSKFLQPISHRAILGAAIRASSPTSVEDMIEQIYNQGNTDSCVGWAYAQNIFLRLKKMGTPIEMPSPVSIYTPARALERSANGQLPKDSALQDGGSSPWLAAQAIAQIGVVSMSAWPFDPTTINAEEDFMTLERASACELQGYAPMASTGAQLCADIDQALAEGFAPVIAVAVDQAFMDYAGSDAIKKPIGAPNASNILGYHMMNCVGKRPDGTRRILNQWGRSWGVGGLATVDDNFFSNPNFVGAFLLPVHATGNPGVFLPKEEKKS